MYYYLPMSRIHTSGIPAETGNPSPRTGAMGASTPVGTSHKVPVIHQMSRSWHILKDRPKAESPGMSHIASGVEEF